MKRLILCLTILAAAPHLDSEASGLSSDTPVNACSEKDVSCPECMNGNYQCTAGGFTETQPSCNGCQARQGLMAALCEAGSKVVESDIQCSKLAETESPSNSDLANIYLNLINNNAQGMYEKFKHAGYYACQDAKVLLLVSKVLDAQESVWIEATRIDPWTLRNFGTAFALIEDIAGRCTDSGLPEDQLPAVLEAADKVRWAMTLE